MRGGPGDSKNGVLGSRIKGHLDTFLLNRLLLHSANRETQIPWGSSGFCNGPSSDLEFLVKHFVKVAKVGFALGAHIVDFLS